MKYLTFIFVSILGLNGTLFASSYKYVEGYITSAGTHLQNFGSTELNQEGLFYFYMDELPGACETSQNRIVITTEHPLFETVISIALTAKASKTKVRAYYLERCTFRNDGWDFGVLMLKEQ